MPDTESVLTLREIMGLLGWSKETLIAAITDGVKLPNSQTVKKLEAARLHDEWRVNESDLDGFISAFHVEEPGRHPPVAVRRALAVETGHACGICEQHHPLQYHNIIEWSELKHYDARYMLAVCGSCHDRIGNGTIDRKSQLLYKRRLQEQADDASLFGGPADAVPWDDLRAVIDALHAALPDVTSNTSQFDLNHTDLKTKNLLNNMPTDYFAVMVEHDEPYFHHIREFLQSTSNMNITIAYHEVVDDLRRRIAVHSAGDSPSFDRVLTELGDTTLRRSVSLLNGKRRTLNRLLSFMYMNCDIGRKA